MLLVNLKGEETVGTFYEKELQKTNQKEFIVEDFNPNNIKIDEKSYKNILVWYIGYLTIKEYVKIYSVNPLYLIFRNVNGYFEEIKKSKYLSLVLHNKAKEKIKDMKKNGLKS